MKLLIILASAIILPAIILAVLYLLVCFIEFEYVSINWVIARGVYVILFLLSLFGFSHGDSIGA